ncbi:selenocysteine lyase/cysteine desulfurase [Thermosporothrix hazakensis]|jgi:selenocysteine lyase/cysteine desulfurase|uniref:Selenocysteine lyase/cysteine desulfurase n=1 Tax=Thermosporothrix hazakensis TaxID=644383 RepID=A0A326UEA0_THEHA|nr:aminotransferase class V-fold PLP-dependent enzyme [Thermosporothrix hazakensis]PZW36364.1 selenocysteine lyase/cysteine desulfurase [Thermosporothrix hazakensis]GCE47013.1 aminotransferase class V [Thermosporothrix hazakensis]
MDTKRMRFDIERARKETPGCTNVLHLNNAGSSLLPQPVLDAMITHLQREAAIGGYEAADEAIDKIEHTYDALATLIGAHRDEIALIENATRAWDMAFYSIPFKPGDRILTAMAEYASNYIAYLQVAQKTGAVVEVIPNDQYGQLSIEALRNMLDERVKLISVTHMPTNGGLVNPVAQIGKIAREAGILFLVDACQTVGQMPIQVDEIGCDILSATGRKYLRGPRGSGFLYVRRSVLEQLEPPMLDLHAATWVSKDRYEIRPDVRRFENWEGNYAAKIALGVAADYAMQWDLKVSWRRIKDLAYRLRSLLSPIPGVIVHDRGITQGGIVTFTIDGVAAEHIQRELAKERINVSISQKSSTLLDMEERQLDQLVRASVHYYNTEEEVERFSACIERLVQ